MILVCCVWCTPEVVLRLFNVLNKHFAILVKHMVNGSILTIWYIFAIVESIEDRLKTNGHSTYTCIKHGHAEVPMQSQGEITVQQSR